MAENEEVIDLSKAKKFFSGIFNKKEGRKGEAIKEKSSEEAISVNWKNVKDFLVKNKILLLLIIPLFLSVYFRMYPSYLPITDDWAKDAVYNSIESNVVQQIDIQYPDLLVANKKTIVDKEFQKVIQDQKSQIDQQIKGTSDYFKSQLKDEKGDTYLIGIDSYFWLGAANNYIKNGNLGTDVINGQSMNMLRNGKRGRAAPTETALPYSEAYVYKILKIFNPDISMMYACFLTPIILMALSIIPTFFIGRKFAGNMGGFFAATTLAIQPFLIGRLSEPDTDIFQIFFPLMILWMFVESVEAKNEKKGFIFAAIAGLLCGLYSTAWKGWWYVFDFIVAATFIYLVYCLICHKKEIKEKGVFEYFKHPEIKNTAIVGLIFIITSFILVSLLWGFNSVMQPISGPLAFIVLKDVGITTIWPNVMTTVAEFNEVPTEQIISMMGGTLFFLIAIAGIFLTMFRKRHGKFDIKYAALFTIWFIASAYAFTKGTRFALLLVPAFAIPFGIALGTAYYYSTKLLIKSNIKKGIASMIVIVILGLLFIAPINSAHAAAKSAIPSMNDAWYDSLTAIKNNSTDAIITSWWDFGHWFVTIGERRVTSDGADQGMRIHWVGKTLLTDNEEESINILKMLNCDQDYAYQKLYDYTNDSFLSVNIIYEMISKNKEDSRKVLQEKTNLSEEQIEDVLKSIYCDNLLEQFYITSDDMVGKAGVWGHFGSWDFKRASMYNTVKGKTQEEGTRILKENFNLSDNEAFTTYYEIQKEKADAWVSGWPGYYSDLTDCTTVNDTIYCQNGLIFNETTNEAFVQTQQGLLQPKSIVYPIKNNKGEEDIFEKVYSESTASYSAALIPPTKLGEDFKSVIMDPLLANSMFTRLYFFKGRGLEHFELFQDKTSFNGNKIIIWKVKF